MSELIKPISKQLLDKDRPNPKLPPRNTSASSQGDVNCSSPMCPNFATSNCGFCQFHCLKIHDGIHYKNSKSEKEIERLIEKYLSNREQRKQDISKEDIKLVAIQANVSLEQAEKALIKNDNDLAKAILSLTSDRNCEI